MTHDDIALRFKTLAGLLDEVKIEFDRLDDRQDRRSQNYLLDGVRDLTTKLEQVAAFTRIFRDQLGREIS
jgi:hypothetical protein